MYILIYFKELAHIFVGTGKPIIYRAGQQARNSGKSYTVVLSSNTGNSAKISISELEVKFLYFRKL